MIESPRKYRPLLHALTPNADPHSPYFFFRNLRLLDADLLISELEVNEARRQLKALQDKLGVVAQEERRKEMNEMQEEGENQRNAQSSSQLPLPVFACPHPGCERAFERESGLQLHALLMHSGRSARPKYQSTFKLQLKAWQGGQ